MTTDKKIKIGAISALVVIVTIVILQNTDPVTTQMLFASVEMPLAFLLFLTFLIGALAGFILGYLRLGSRLKKIEKKK